ncbi:thioredoxin [Leucobacter sp. M11]|uniref:thioredoxin n=1 Tax=Leucobacter sp. M11 TaxID=2993565 RepID=UPI002D7F215E|nr:thioredoxin [Leucobacter sp. M11]MEB4613091.1 thioredoxin [Leucobacter sp. M11]
MATIDITQDSWTETVSSGIVLVDFWAAWCGPCRSFAPVYERVSEANPDAVFAKVDTEAEQELSAGFGITSIPTLMIFREGILVFAQPGALAQAQLEDLLGQVRALDMDEVRRQVEAEERARAEAAQADTPSA